ncbi:hypothetical protein [Streptomyces muensis]|nr:hypothetical protein [Streptomyces muensis]
MTSHMIDKFCQDPQPADPGLRGPPRRSSGITTARHNGAIRTATA